MANCLGTFLAQYSAFFSLDPNTIFRFYVFSDRFFRLKVGSAKNQLPGIALGSGVPGRAIGLQERLAGRLPTLQEMRGLVEGTAERSWFHRLSTSVSDLEISYEDIETCVVRPRGFFFRDRFTLRTREGARSLYFLPEGQDVPAAVGLLREALGGRCEARP